MKRPTPNPQQQTGGVKETKEYTLASTGVILSLLADELYQNPPRAILRELGCNAYDAHARIGKEDVPFIVNIPTKMNQNFAIRDFGVSMTEKEFEERYLAIGESDKLDTNKEDGTYGIGSKSPFAYVKTYNTTVYKDGTERIYIIKRDEDNNPVAQFMYEGETDKPDGVKVSFDVSLEDVDKFQHEARQVFRWFQTQPLIVGTIPEDLDDLDPYDLDISPPEANIEGEDYIVTGKSYRSYLVMGNVAYQIDSNEIENYHSGVVIYAETGEVDPTPNRQQLKYSSKTVDFLEQKFKSIAETQKQEAREDIENSDNLLEAKKVYYKYSGSRFVDALEYNNQKISTSKVKFPPCRKYVNGNEGKIKRGYNRGERRKQVISKVPVIVWADENHAKYVKTQQLSQKLDRPCYVFDDEDTFEDFMDKIDKENPDYLVSELEKDNVSSSHKNYTPSTYAKADWVKFRVGYEGYQNKKYWECIETPSRAYYVLVKRWKFSFRKGTGFTQPYVLLQNYLEPLQNVGLNLSPVMGVKPASIDKVPENWTPLILGIQQFLEWMRPFAKKEAQQHRVQSRIKGSRYAIPTVEQISDFDVNDPRFQELAEYTTKPDIENITSWKNLYIAFKELPYENKIKEYEDLKDEIINDYPLLSPDISTEHYVEYIQGVNS